MARLILIIVMNICDDKDYENDNDVESDIYIFISYKIMIKEILMIILIDTSHM